jgi:hypothetical protein
MLLAQCDECSSRQSGLVKKLNVQNDPTDYMDSLPEKDQDIILGGRTPKISSSGSKRRKFVSSKSRTNIHSIHSMRKRLMDRHKGRTTRVGTQSA